MKLSKLPFLFILLCSLTVFGQAQNKRLSTVVCQWQDAKTQSMGLYSIQNCELQEIATSKTTNGQFAFAFYPEKEGYYAIAQNPNSSFYRFVFYFKPGDDLSFKIINSTFVLTNEKKNSDENKEIARWQQFVQPLSSKAIYFMNEINSTYEDYFPLLEKTLPAYNAYPKAATKNKKFNASFEDFKKYDFAYINYMFLNTPRSKHPEANDYIDYYKNIDVKDLTRSTSLLHYPQGLTLIESHYYTSLRANKSLNSEQLGQYMQMTTDTILRTPAAIVNDTLRGEFALFATKRIRTYPGIMQYKKQYGKLLITDDQQKRFTMIQAKYDNNEAGHEAIDFKFPDADGKLVALSDFKGKVVYIDVWATWCGPCNGEIPHLKKLEEAYHNNPNIVFMSVSVDQSKDIEKWKKMLKDKEMGGVQLFAGDNKKYINEPYKIKGIPRFILISKDGMISNADAPRPSSSEIRPLLDAELKK